MSNETTQHTPADVRERVKEAWATVEAAALAQANVLDSHYGGQRAKAAEIRNAVEQVAALLRTPRGEGEAEALAAEILAELRRAREKFPGNNVMTLALVEEVGELAKATFEESRDRVRQEAIQVAVMAMRVVLDGDQTLDAWREAKGLDPLVVAARRGEGGGDGPVGAACANCGAPSAAIAGGELDPDEAVCSVECYEQLRELGCPQEHGGTYRPKPARRGEGGGDGD